MEVVPFPRSLDRLPQVVPPEEEVLWIRRLRAEPTEAEAALWPRLRDRQLFGVKFRRQVPLGRYVADFYCHERKLVLELDGAIHAEESQQDHDGNRDLYLRSLGLRVLRLSNEEVLATPRQALERIRQALVSA